MNKHSWYRWLVALNVLLGLLISGCEDVIELETEQGTPQLAVDAFLTDQFEKQVVRLTVTSQYFSTTSASPALGAIVTVVDETSSQVYSFDDVNTEGNYEWIPTSGDTMGKAGHTYSLNVIYKGDTFTGFSTLNPVPNIDSLTVEYRPVDPPQSFVDGYYVSFYAYDIRDRVDYYWIRSYRNDTLESNPLYLNYSTDGAFNGRGAAGFLFILPIREAVTPFDKPFNVGDSVRVELWSIPVETFYFIGEAQAQMANVGLFAEPPANVPTNMANRNKNSDVTPVGWFNFAGESSSGLRVK